MLLPLSPTFLLGETTPCPVENLRKTGRTFLEESQSFPHFLTVPSPHFFDSEQPSNFPQVFHGVSPGHPQKKLPRLIRNLFYNSML